MKFKTICRTMLLGTITVTLFACGGGGGSSASNGNNGGNNSALTDNTVVSGVAAKGVFKSGTVRIYEVKADGSEGEILKETVILDANGKYRAELGKKYTGSIIVKVFGVYTDEATNKELTVPEDAPLTAAVPASVVVEAATSKKEVSVPVTPLTDIALKKAKEAGGNLNGTIDNANKAISQVFAVDIVKTLPVRYDSASLSDTKTTDDQKKYTAVLATVSKMIESKAKENTASAVSPSADDLRSALTKTLTDLSSGVTVNVSGATVTAQVASAELADKLNKAREEISNSDLAPQEIKPVIADLPKLPTVTKFKLKTSGAITSNIINGIQLTLGLPTGLTLKGDSISGNTDPGVISVTGVASGATLEAKTKSVSSGVNGELSIGLISAAPFGIGEFATIYVVVPAGSTIPAVSGFSPITNLKVVDAKGVKISGVTVEVFQ